MTPCQPQKRKRKIKKCEHEGCEKCAQGSTNFCIAHGGGNRCQFPGCTKGSRDIRYCTAHGGGKRCSMSDCKKAAVGASDLCTSHGGGRKCIAPGCQKSAQSPTNYCVRHGGGRTCEMDECRKVARGKSNFCASHGGGPSCSIEECGRQAISNTQFCREHRPPRPRKGTAVAKCATSVKGDQTSDHHPSGSEHATSASSSIKETLPPDSSAGEFCAAEINAAAILHSFSRGPARKRSCSDLENSAESDASLPVPPSVPSTDSHSLPSKIEEAPNTTLSIANPVTSKAPIPHIRQQAYSSLVTQTRSTGGVTTDSRPRETLRSYQKAYSELARYSHSHTAILYAMEFPYPSRYPAPLHPPASPTTGSASTPVLFPSSECYSESRICQTSSPRTVPRGPTASPVSQIDSLSTHYSETTRSETSSNSTHDRSD